MNMTTEITGTEEHLQTLIQELEEEGIEVRTPWDKVRHITLWGIPGDRAVVGYYHKENAKLNANLPSHRKSFIKKCKKVLP